MKKNTYIFQLLSLFIALSIMVSCGKDDDKPNTNKVEVTIKAKYSEEIDYSNFKVKITDLRTNSTTEKDLNNGSTKVELNRDIYSFEIEGIYNNITYFGKKESHSIKNTETIEININQLITQKAGFIINELFFFGNFAKDAVTYQYLTIYNNGEEILYADGIVIAESAHNNSNFNQLGDTFSKSLPNDIVVQKLYQIPGTGKDYPVEPGKQIVIATNAINHGEKIPGAPDYSGADFEAYETHDSNLKDIDNPNVENLIRHFGLQGSSFNYFPFGAHPVIIFHPMKDMSTFMEENKIEYGTGDNKLFLYKVPSNLVLDGIESGMQNNLKQKALPANVDRGSILNDNNIGYLIKRKTTIKNGKERLVDTNNSTEDCIIEKEPTSYPAK